MQWYLRGNNLWISRRSALEHLQYKDETVTKILMKMFEL